MTICVTLTFQIVVPSFCNNTTQPKYRVLQQLVSTLKLFFYIIKKINGKLIAGLWKQWKHSVFFCFGTGKDENNQEFTVTLWSLLRFKRYFKWLGKKNGFYFLEDYSIFLKWKKTSQFFCSNGRLLHNEKKLLSFFSRNNVRRKPFFFIEAKMSSLAHPKLNYLNRPLFQN